MNGTIGRIVYDQAPTPKNPRNSEGAFITLRDGRLLFAYSHYIGESPADDAKCCIAAIYSMDQGESWSEPRILIRPEDHGAINVMSVSLLRMQNDDIGLFYINRQHLNEARLHMRRSSDDGETWSDAICCVPNPGYYVTNNDRVVRLSCGRLIVPTALRKFQTEEHVKRNGLDARGTVFFFYSDDDGQSWHEANHAAMIPAPLSKSGLQEPLVVELNNGSLWSLSRTDMGRQYEIKSFDRGMSWSQPVPSQFTSPQSPISMKRIPNNGHLLAIWNPIPNYQTRSFDPFSAGRVPLVGAISRDEGVTWEKLFYCESEQAKGGYSYVTIHFLEDEVLLAYCAGEPGDGNNLSRLRIRKIKLNEVIG